MSDDPKKILVDRLNELVQRSGLCQQDLADRAGISQATVSRLLLGQWKKHPVPSERNLRAMAVGLNMPWLDFRAALGLPPDSLSEAPGHRDHRVILRLRLMLDPQLPILSERDRGKLHRALVKLVRTFERSVE